MSSTLGDSMRSETDQFDGLKAVVLEAAKQFKASTGKPLPFGSCTIVWNPGDVVAIDVKSWKRGMQIVYASGNYDVWEGRHLTRKTDLPLSAAVKVLIEAVQEETARDESMKRWARDAEAAPSQKKARDNI